MPFDPRDQNDLAAVEARYTDCVHVVTLNEYVFLDADWMLQFIRGRWHSRVKKPSDPRQGVKYQFFFDNERDAVLFGLRYS